MTDMMEEAWSAFWDALPSRRRTEVEDLHGHSECVCADCDHGCPPWCPPCRGSWEDYLDRAPTARARALRAELPDLEAR